MPLTKRGVLSVIFNFNIAVNLVSAQAAGAHTFVPCDKSMQKRTCAGSPKEVKLPSPFVLTFSFLLFLRTFYKKKSVLIGNLTFLLCSFSRLFSEHLCLKRMLMMDTATLSFLYAHYGACSFILF